MSASDMQRFGTYNAVLPKEGPKTFPFTLDFTATNLVTVDFTLPIQQGFISFVSGFYIDNLVNSNPVTIQGNGAKHKITIPAQRQALMPLFIGDDPVIEIRTTSGGTILLPFQVVNFPVSPCVWSG